MTDPVLLLLALCALVALLAWCGADLLDGSRDGDRKLVRARLAHRRERRQR